MVQRPTEPNRSRPRMQRGSFSCPKTWCGFSLIAAFCHVRALASSEFSTSPMSRGFGRPGLRDEAHARAIEVRRVVCAAPFSTRVPPVHAKGLRDPDGRGTAHIRAHSHKIDRQSAAVVPVLAGPPSKFRRSAGAWSRTRRIDGDSRNACSGARSHQPSKQ